MKDEYKYALRDLANSVHNYINDYKDNEKPSMFVRKNLAESYIAIECLLENKFIEPHEKVILKRDLSKIFNKVYNEESLYYYSSFSYAYQNIKSNDVEKVQNQFNKINLDTMAMLLSVRSILKNESDLGTSTDNYFFSRIERCTWAFEYVINHELEEYYIPSLYCICNMMQTLSLYYKAGKSKYRSSIVPLMELLKKQLDKYLLNEKANEIIKSNNQIKYFLYNQFSNYSNLNNIHYNVSIEINEIINERTRGILRILTSLYNININIFNQYFELKFNMLFEECDNMDIIDKILFLRVLSDYLKCKCEDYPQLELGLYEEVNKINIEEFLNQTFNLNEIRFDDIEENHLEKLMRMKDNELRIKFSKTIRGVNKSILDRESHKPHGSFEISDMEVQISYYNKKYYLCMPFKSGVEIQGKTVPVDIAYQIVRPFIEFKSCIVVFVTAKKCSENLMNYIKKLKDKLGWPIEVIEEKTLAGLLIMNNEL